MRSQVEEVESLVARVGTHPVWGYAHCQRVHEQTRELAEEEGMSYDPEILHISALLHDIGLYKAYNLREAPDHARRSATVAERILSDLDFPPEATRMVTDAVVHHPPGAKRGRSMEATLLKDAVALDYLGAVGLSRVLAMVGLEDDVPDLPAAVRHAESLHRSIPGFLTLESSARIARERVAQTNSFLDDLRGATANLELL
ncbi:MAG: HD domain-containing protein [Rubrobacter sp.]|nr:HD domain-containing protein [Rubrobacter sp.]